MKTIRIFISSPGDVAEERERAKRVVESFRNDFKLFRAAGHDHPDMKKIEGLLDEGM